MKADAKALSRFVVQNWPRAREAFKEVDAFLKDHPAVPLWFRGRVEDLRKRFEVAQLQRSDAGRIRATLEIVRTEVRGVQGQPDPALVVDPTSWLQRADNIERRVRLAEAQSKPEQRKTLARLRAEADALIADLIDESAADAARPTPQKLEAPAEDQQETP